MIPTLPVPRQPQILIHPNAKCLLQVVSNADSNLILFDEILGRKKSIQIGSAADVRELSMGLDFGTSSVKVVIGDHASDVAYAVPFLEDDGIDAYLLPSRLFEHVEDDKVIFSLEKFAVSHRDLKLGLLGSPDSEEKQVHVIAFLSIVIARARAWLFSEHVDIYQSVKCLWRVRIGLPAASALESEYVPLFRKLVHAAWILAAQKNAPSYTQAVELLHQVSTTSNADDTLEVDVIPEIAAQIFGFVSSTSFDPKAPNRFLIVDVGAGTVDSSLFQVKPSRGGRWDFEFYTAVVQPYGVSNLNAHRIDWWTDHLVKVEAGGQLIESLKACKFATDLGFQLPDKVKDYVSGVQFDGLNPDSSDVIFFDNKLMAQVQGTTLWRAWKDGYLSQSQLSHTPMFLCGGGARSLFYLGLESALIYKPSFSWLSAEAWTLGFPGDLECDGVDDSDFDRLSVAYGLSKLDVGSVTKATPLPLVTAPPSEPFSDRYIDKDQC